MSLLRLTRLPTHIPLSKLPTIIKTPKRFSHHHHYRRLDNEVALITGASAGIGKESAFLFAKEGAKLILVDKDPNGQHIADQINREGGEALFQQVDVSDENQIKDAINIARNQYGKLTVLFNNAGIMHHDDDDAIKTSEKVFDVTFAINVKSVFFGCKHALPLMIKQQKGSIINTASFVAKLGAATPQLAYTASKGAVLAMTRELAVIHARQGIRVNSLCPGPLRTKLLMDFLDTEEKRQRRLVHVPMGRFGEASEMAKAALFLASSESSYITGADFMVDGGITAAYVTPLGEPKMPN